MIKTLLKDSIIYGISKYLSVFAAIFLMPIYTRLLSEADYGIMEIVNSWNTFVIVLLPLGLSSSIIRFQRDMEGHVRIKNGYLGTILLTLSGLCAVYVGLMIVLKPYLVQFLGNYPGIDEIYYHSIFIAVSSIYLEYFLTLLQAQLRKIHYLIVSITNLMVMVILGFVLVYNFNMGIVGFFRASSIALVTALLLCFLLTRSDLTLRFSKKVLSILLRYSVHILSVGLLFNSVNLLDRYILVKYAGLEEVGIYSIGVRISGIMGLAIGSFALAWFPIAMGIKDDAIANTTYRRVHDFYFLFALFLFVGILIGRRELIEVFAPSYGESTNVIAYLAAYSVINGSIYFYSLGIHITKKTKYLTYSALASIVVNITTSVILVQSMGVDGVALGTLFGAIVWVVIQFIFSERLRPIHFNLKLVVFSIIVGVLVLFGTPMLDDFLIQPIGIRILIKLVVLGIIGLLLFYLFLGKERFAEILHLLRGKK